MKIIGIDEGGRYICTVEHSELEKVADKYYGHLQKLRAGQEFNLGAGYDFRSDIKQACQSMADAERDFDRARGTLHRFASMVATLPAAAKELEPAA